MFKEDSFFSPKEEHVKSVILNKIIHIKYLNEVSRLERQVLNRAAEKTELKVRDDRIHMLISLVRSLI